MASVPAWVPQNIWSMLKEVTLGLTGTSSATTMGAALSLMSLAGKIGKCLVGTLFFFSLSLTHTHTHTRARTCTAVSSPLTHSAVCGDNGGCQSTQIFWVAGRA
jgi:hypothetical protein